MKTINDMLPQPENGFQGFSRWLNKAQVELAKIMHHRATRIDVQYTPVEYYSDGVVDGVLWLECQHASTSPQVEELWDAYQEVVTGTPQPVTYKTVQVCDECDAWYSEDGTWYLS